MNIHVFNPEHDIALAANSRFWTPPHAGRQLRADLGWLPALWAEEGDVVVVDDTAQAANAVRKLSVGTRKVEFVTMANLAKMLVGDCRVMPWGWDLSIVQQLRRAGVSDDMLPADDVLARQREISDRATAARLLNHLTENCSQCCGEAVAITDVAEIDQMMERWGRVVLKAPWSSSGRGVRYMDQRPNNIIRWAEKVVKTQGHLMVERFQDKVMDFGMEFHVAEDGSVTYEGLSLFDTSGGAYTGSVLATEQEKMQTLGRLLPEALLLDVQQYICRWMEQEVKDAYRGPFGVDMMICKTADGALNLDPCVEINLRRTMGHVALAISPRQNDMQQVMRIGYEGTNYHFRIYNDHEILV